MLGAMLNFICFAGGVIVAGIVICFTQYREGSPWSQGWTEGWNAASKYFGDYDRGWEEGVKASYHAMADITKEHYRSKVVDKQPEA